MKKIEKFLNEIGVQVKSSIPKDDGMIWVTKADGSYITRVGMEDNQKYLIKRNFTQIQSAYEGVGKPISLAFNKEEQKWYGWSHRAMYGFGIDSECKIGDCGFLPANEEEFIESCFRFWVDDYSYAKKDTVITEVKDGKGYNNTMTKGVSIRYIYNDEVPNVKLRGTEYSNFTPFPDKWGKGQWTAKTLEEAKEMAIDFANGVS